MSSFKKTGTSPDPRLAGTQMKNSIPSVSCGIPSLDYVIGGGIPVGTVFMIEEDALGSYSRVLCKFFLAEGVVCGQHALAASVDDDPAHTVKELPSPLSVKSESDVRDSAEDQMKIAWRYEGQAAVESSFGINTNFGHHFDLSKHIDVETVNSSHISYWHKCTSEKKSPEFQNSLYYDLLQEINQHVSKDEYKLSSKSSSKHVLRICISSIGSPLWMSHHYEDGCNPHHVGRDLAKFMYCLRIMLRDTTAVALVTLPTHLFEDKQLTKRLLISADTAVRLESFAGSARETNPAFKDYHGLFHLTKLSAYGALAPHVPPSLDLAFKLRRKKFVIEKLHLPPELQDSSEREQDDITATPVACGGFKKKDIDF